MDLEQATTSQPVWSALSGTPLAGGYEVGDIMAADEHRARFRVRVLGDWSANAFLDAFRLRAADSQDQAAIWTAAQQLQHPNLSSPLASGEWQHEGATLTYVVAKTPDETLAGLLQERATTTPEALEVLTSLRRALGYLHANGWVHGHLAPEQVLAFGDSIRISSEYLVQTNAADYLLLISPKYVAPESSVSNRTAAADVWCLGATLYEALTQHPYTADRLSAVGELPEPFNRVVARCVDPDPQTRCSLADIDDLTKSPRPAVSAQNKPTVVPNTPTEEKAIPPVLTRAASRNADVDAPEAKSYRFWIYAAVCALVLLLLVWAVWPRKSFAPVASARVPVDHQSPPAAVPAPRPNTPESKSLPADAGPVPETTSANSQTPVKTTAESSHTVNGSIWRVVVFTYAREADAAKKAQSLNQKHPNIDAQVFNPSGQGSAYLVTLGGKMTREDASRLRQRALSLGLPHDSYIQNYKQ